MNASTVPYLELVLEPAASVAAVRETSILFTVGPRSAILLHEQVTSGRAAGAALVVDGAGLVTPG